MEKLLTTIDIAEVLQMSNRTVRDCVVKQYGFPPPVVPARGRAKRWRPEDIKRWIEGRR